MQQPQDWKRSTFISVLKKGNAKKCSNYHIIALILHASKVTLKILQARLQQHINLELQMYKLDFEKVEEQRLNFQHLLDHGESKGVPEKHLLMFH